MLKKFPYLPYFFAGMFVLIFIEFLWSRRTNRNVYTLKETLANLGIFTGFQISKLMFASYQLYIFTLAQRFTPMLLPKNIWTFAVTFIVIDFLYYWHHRAMHEIKFFWSFHLVHHSSLWYNLTTSYRLNWFGSLIGVFFYLPAVLIGLPPEFIVASLALNLFFQFFLHTEAIGSLGVLEGVVNTPSAHRVHHGSNERYIDKNHGGVLMIWDRLFGTYQTETEQVKYGITTGFVSYNPFTLVFHGFVDMAKGKLAAKG
jgi:sterol desaturase/sphingolipid hydroxylase (fatty acid hydroxylase superfamily)